MQRDVFLNLPVSDVGRAETFFSQIGFSFDPTFADDAMRCLIINDTARVMLISREKFGTFLPGEVCEASRCNESIVSVTCGSRDEVDSLFDKACAAGGQALREAADYGCHYVQGFADPDGHYWELVHIVPDNPDAPQPG